MYSICHSIVIDLGGKIANESKDASHVVIFDKTISQSKLKSRVLNISKLCVINYKWITESYFYIQLLPIEEYSIK